MAAEEYYDQSPDYSLPYPQAKRSSYGQDPVVREMPKIGRYFEIVSFLAGELLLSRAPGRGCSPRDERQEGRVLLFRALLPRERHDAKEAGASLNNLSLAALCLQCVLYSPARR